MLTKEEYENALDIIEEGTTEYEDSCSIPRTSYNEFEEQIRILRQLIKEHFDPQPYKFEEYYDGMFVWDDEWKQLRELMDAQDFEEGRFFPITKAMQYQEKD